MTMLRVKGLPLTRAPLEVDAEGFAVFYLDPEKVDWTDACSAARAQIFPGASLPELDAKYEAIMLARRERERKAAA
jgi:hypothetical protein